MEAVRVFSKNLGEVGGICLSAKPSSEGVPCVPPPCACCEPSPGMSIWTPDDGNGAVFFVWCWKYVAVARADKDFYSPLKGFLPSPKKFEGACYPRVLRAASSYLKVITGVLKVALLHPNQSRVVGLFKDIYDNGEIMSIGDIQSAVAFTRQDTEVRTQTFSKLALGPPRGTGECAVCLLKTVDTALPCGHCLCRSCWCFLREGQRKCPSCRHPFGEEGLRIYL